MTGVRPVRDEIDAEVRRWRAGATHVVLSAVVLAALALFVSVVLGKLVVLPLMHAWFAGAVSGVLAAALCIPRRHYRWRATILLCSLYAMAVEQMAAYGLVGDGRIALLVLPLLALVLLGAREGWIAAFFTSALLAVFALLVAYGILPRLGGFPEKSTDPDYWLLQVLMLLAALVPLMLLFTRLLARQTQTMVAERQTRRELESESAARRRLEDEITRVGEEERRRLGSELHDGLCQHLTAALLHCTAVENQLAAGNMPEAVPAGRLRSMIEESIGMAYDVCKGLCPLDVSPESLASALERLTRQTRETTGLACDFRTEGAVAIGDPQKALHLFRIAQEAVNNAVKHARCRVIQVELLGVADSLTLRIQDDGAGHRPDAEPKAGGLGVLIMEYRAEAIGGTLTIDHPSGGGTVVTCRVSAQAVKENQA